MSKSSTITRPVKGIRVYPPIHPGEMLREEFLVPLGLKPYTLAKNLHVPRTRVERLVREEVGLTTDMALRLARYFGMSPEFWLNMQLHYELGMAEQTMAKAIAAIEPMQREDQAA